MKRYILVILLLEIFAPSIAQTEHFVGSTPCGSAIRSSLNFPPEALCEFIKVELTLDGKDKGTFQLALRYGEGQPNTNGFKGGGVSANFSGDYSTTTGAFAQPKAIVYYLTAKDLNLLLVKMDENILLVTDNKKNILVGNGGYSYVLNRVTKMKLTSKLFVLALAFALPTVLAQTQGEKNALLGVFDGRSPCQEIAKQLGEPVTSACIKIKWRLTLYTDSVTGKPSHYELLGLFYKKPNPRKGEWRIVQGTFRDSDATVYQLDAAGKDPILLQKVDNNILMFLDEKRKLRVGNNDFSFALNRTK